MQVCRILEEEQCSDQTRVLCSAPSSTYSPPSNAPPSPPEVWQTDALTKILLPPGLDLVSPPSLVTIMISALRLLKVWLKTFQSWMMLLKKNLLKNVGKNPGGYADFSRGRLVHR